MLLFHIILAVVVLSTTTLLFALLIRSERKLAKHGESFMFEVRKNAKN
jgi:hypothetical protein